MLNDARHDLTADENEALIGPLTDEAIHLGSETGHLLRSLQRIAGFSTAGIIGVVTIAAGGESWQWVLLALPIATGLVSLFGLEVFAEIVSLGALRRSIEQRLAQILGHYVLIRETANARASRFDPGRAGLALVWAAVHLVACIVGIETAQTAYTAAPFDRPDGVSLWWLPSEREWLALYISVLAIIAVAIAAQALNIFWLQRETLRRSRQQLLSTPIAFVTPLQVARTRSSMMSRIGGSAATPKQHRADTNWARRSSQREPKSTRSVP